MPSGCAGSRSAASPRSTPSASAEASAGEGSSSSWSVPRIAWLPTMVTVVTPAMGAAARATCRASSRRTCILQQGPSGVLVKDCLRLMVAERVGEPRGHRPCGTGVQLEAERLEPVLERVAARDLVTGFVAGQGCSVHAGGCSGMEVFRWMSASMRRRGVRRRAARARGPAATSPEGTQQVVGVQDHVCAGVIACAGGADRQQPGGRSAGHDRPTVGQRRDLTGGDRLTGPPLD